MAPRHSLLFSELPLGVAVAIGHVGGNANAGPDDGVIGKQLERSAFGPAIRYLRSLFPCNSFGRGLWAVWALAVGVS